MQLTEIQPWHADIVATLPSRKQKKAGDVGNTLRQNIFPKPGIHDLGTYPSTASLCTKQL